ncbi:LOW QUALITY PROTEIN: uncharacterized protein lrrc69 [Lycodopsis pacificus]
MVRALYGKATSLALRSKLIKVVPTCVSRITNLLNSSSISTLPAELLSLQHLAELNLGNNALNEVPAVLGHLESLKKLYLFSNQITAVPPDAIDGLRNLAVLNLNHNQIQRLPPEIKSLSRLRRLSVLDNKLEEVPVELAHLTGLTEINYNLSWLPQQLYQCKDLTKLHAARNKLTSLPAGIGALAKLQVLDMAGNKLSMFPVEVQTVLANSALTADCEPTSSVQDAEELTLKVKCHRSTDRTLRICITLLCKIPPDRYRSSLVHMMLRHYPTLTALLANGSCCALCLDPFLLTWLECVHFISLNKDMKMRSLQTIPVLAHLCSYKCLNMDGHSYYGVATR